MGSHYMLDLADVCRRTGYPVIEVSGWPYQARGSGGYDSGRPNHVMVHHTASGPGSDGWPDVNYCTFGDEDAPLCNLYLSRDGTIYVCAGGATNTNGTGHDPCGVTADDSMNSSAIGIEAGNDGVGERWPDRMLDSYNRLCAELCSAYGIPTGRIHAHFEWAPQRKTDPAGPDRYASGAVPWNMASFRADCAGPSPSPTPDPEEGDDVTKPQMWKMPADPGTYVVYLNGTACTGTKTWLPSGESVEAFMALAAINGWDQDVKVQHDEHMFRAFGPVVGPRPGGTDAWGVKT